MTKPEIPVARLRRVRVVRESVGKVVQILSNKKIRVRQSGAQAYVQFDERTQQPVLVNIPVINDDASDTLINAIQGFLDHEVAHLLFTDHMVGVKAAKMGKDYHFFWNALEDCFIERKMVQGFTGSRQNLTHTRKMFSSIYIEPKFKELVDKPDSTENDFWNILSVCAIRAWAGQSELVDFMDDKWEYIADVEDAVEHLKDRIEKTVSSQECLELAIEIRNAIYGKKDPEKSKKDKQKSTKTTPQDDTDDQPDPQQPEQPENSDDDTESDASNSNSEKQPESAKDEGDSEDGDAEESEPSDNASEDDADDGSGSKDEDDSEGETNDEDDSEGKTNDEDDSEGEDEDGEGEEPDAAESAPAKANNSEPEKSDEDADSDSGQSTNIITDTEANDPVFSEDEFKGMSPDFDSIIESIVGDEAVSSHSASDYVPYTTEHDVIEKFEPPGGNYATNFEEMENALKTMVGTLQKHLERAFVAMNKSRWESGRRKGRVAPANLARLAFDDDRVFRQKETQRTRDVAVTLLIDCSGSMSGAKMYTACQAAWAMGEVLDRLKINCEIIGFTTRYSLDIATIHAIQDDPNRHLYERTAPIYMPIFKEFGERFGTHQKTRLVSYAHGEGEMSTNIDGESLRYAANRLQRQRQEGKAMIVLSDGMPCGGPNTCSHLKLTVESLEREGVNVVGMGICSSAVERFYRKSVILNDIKELPGTVIARLKDILLQR